MSTWSRRVAPAPRLGQYSHRVLAHACFGAADLAELTGHYPAGPPRPRDEYQAHTERESTTRPRFRAEHYAAERDTGV